MKIIKAKAFLENPFSGISDISYMEQMLKHIEKVGRTCYKSEDKITDDSYKTFIKMLIDKGHEAMLEHGSFSVRFIVDRGVSHEIVRHRIASFAQESTRYCNYSKDKFDNEITVIRPCYFEEDSVEMDNWAGNCMWDEKVYLSMLDQGRTPQEARAILPTSLKTELVMTANFREWRNFFKLRTSKDAHPQMREITIPLLEYLKSICPVMFDDITWEE